MQELGVKQDFWLQALESDAYQQGICVLKDDNDKYCCLGVACEIFKTAATKIKDEEEGYTTFDGNDLTAPAYVINALALRGESGESDFGGKSLTFLNDSDKLTFKEIAQVIRNAPAVYFEKPA